MLLLVGLATYRASCLLSYDDGPWYIFRRLRAWAGKQAARRGGEWAMFAEWLHCPYCNGIWFAGFFVILWLLGERLLIMLLAIAGVQSLLLDNLGGRDALAK